MESLLCARVADKLAPELPATTPTRADGPRHRQHRQPLDGRHARVTGTIARTVTNIRAGARTPLAGMVHALAVLTAMLVAAPLALHVPLAVLAGLLLFVAFNMGEWHEFGRLRHRRAVPHPARGHLW